ncbi:hypothetical protein [Limosilactobacillus reuteri]|uniref:hypothetical protein n=1 Tax=Limosilactobacillus reuteri TaxID=1598 RepID=UPI003D079BCD
MDFKNEISEFNKLRKKYFKNFYSNSSKKPVLTKAEILHLFQIINFFQILKDYDVTSNNALPKLSEMCLDTLYNLLIAILTNNDLFIAACTRQFDEELLEIVYSEFCTYKSTKEILKLNYRKLWENGIHNSLSYRKLATTQRSDKKEGIIREKDKLDAINNLFKKDSDKLHFKYQDVDSTKYLEQIIKKGTEFSKSNLSSHINQYYIFCIDLLPIIIKLDINLLSHNQKHEYLSLIKSLQF